MKLLFLLVEFVVIVYIMLYFDFPDVEITKRPIKIFIIILKRVIRVQQNIKIALNINVFTYIKRFALHFKFISYPGYHAIIDRQIAQYIFYKMSRLMVYTCYFDAT